MYILYINHIPIFTIIITTITIRLYEKKKKKGKPSPQIRAAGV